jgi:hypothetical protein
MKNQNENQDEKRTYNIGEAQVLVETPKALLIANGETDDQGRPAGYWVPKSQIDITSDIQSKGDTGDLIVAEWIAVKNGFEVESNEG